MLGVVSVALLVLALLALFLPRPTWVERIAQKANKGVVLIETSSTTGTGFVIASHKERHLIMTNRHVVDGLADCLISGRHTLPVNGRIVGLAADDQIDLALVVAQSDGLRPLGSIASFRSVRSGEEVVAVGHPFGLEYTVTDGIISAKRSGLMLQTTAAINPGNSGGPLLNRHGQIVGVNTMVIRAENADRLGFAIRADFVFDDYEWEFSEDISDLLAKIRR